MGDVGGMSLRPYLFLLLTASVAQAGVEVDIEKFGTSLGGWNKEKNKAAQYKFSETDYRTYKPEVTTAPDGGVFISVRVDHVRGRFSSDDHASLEMSFAPDGTLLGKVLVPEVVANVAWGWPKRNRLYICATTSLYSILLAVNGAKTM